MIDKYLSDKLKVISFFSMIMVVFLHSYNLEENILQDPCITKGYSFLVQFFISQGLARIAVPIFFIISGYLLFLNKNYTSIEYFLILKKRFKSLVIPYLFWSCLLFVVFFLLQSLPQAAPFFKQKHIINYTFTEVLQAIFIYPIPFQLWFIRDLFILIFFSPLLYVIIKYAKNLLLLILLTTWWFQFDFIIFSNEAILFFTVGGTLAVKKLDLNIQIFSKISILLLFLWVFIILSETILVYKSILNKSILNSIHKSGILVGIVAIWSVYDFLHLKTNIINLKFISLTKTSFFIYVCHEPLLEILKIVSYKIFGSSQFLKLIVYFTIPLLIIPIFILVGFWFKKNAPNFFSIVTGGR